MSCFGKKYSFINVDEQLSESDVLEGAVYVCENYMVAQLKCPCGCGAVIYLNLLPDENPQRVHPRWKVIGNSITPSINRTVGCRSHFSITNGITHK